MSGCARHLTESRISEKNPAPVALPRAPRHTDIRRGFFAKSKSPVSLPLTSDALIFHVKRSHYQATIFRQAHISHPNIPSPVEMGWKLEGEKLLPVLPVPDSCHQLISYQCTTGSRTTQCKCRRVNLTCTSVCGCADGICSNGN